MKRIKLMSLAVISTALIIGCSKEEAPTESQQSAPVQQTQATQQPAQQQQSQEQQKPQEQKSEEQQHPAKEEQKSLESKKEEKKTETTVAKVDGESIFKSKGCTACHQAAADTVGPALKKIASAYNGKKEDLIKFFSGEGKAIVDPAKEAVMKPQIEITKKLSKEEKEALAEFILKH
ncbi:c-type cytochrome [Sulfurihydrogenibium azorense]|uniref:c-type cytochrome n=1 Tax=Sulfurihydrogenibium azorense TaxID=309806 RepID=UPI002409C5A0|nr:c-type cytochrome [Sulfurihydrogenibium azorense]MDM7273335.1 c-type cytochrome [Sulfurihydrogenibium azorense]